MSQEITTAFVQAYRDNVFHTAQQKGSKLAGVFKRDSFTGTHLYIERIEPTIASVKTARHAPTPLTESQHSRRRVTIADYQWADLIDKEDKLRMLIDPQSDYVMAASWAIGRAMDQVAITAFAADVETGQDGSGTATFDATMEVNLSSGLTVDVLRQSSFLLDANDVPSEGRVFVASMAGKRQLLGTTEATSTDYNSVQALVKGDIDSFYGFNFIWIAGSTNDMGLPLTGNNRTCYFFQRDAMVMAVNQDLMVRIDVRPDLQYATQVYVCATFGAVRLDEAAVGRAIIDESV
jgi:hypothetical protein